MPAGSRIDCVAHWNNSTTNAANCIGVSKWAVSPSPATETSNKTP